MQVLGLSGHFHDAAAALVVDGRVVAAAQEERFSRIKHDAATPLRAAAFCLRQGGLQPGDLDAVIWYEKPLRKLERVLLTALRTWPWGATSFRRAARSMLGDKLWVRAQLAEHLKVDPSRIQFSAHHQSHAMGAWCCSPFDEAAVLCVDGVGEWTTTSLWRAGPGGLTPLAEQHFPHSLGLLYSVFTAFLGFEVNEGEYKLMGLSAFGQPTRLDDVARLVRRSGDGSFELDMAYFRFDRDPERAWTPAFEALFGPPRAPGGPIEARHQELAASIQRLTEDLLLDLARALHARTGLRHLCLAGGVALNAVAVGRLIREGPFDDVYVMPAAGDAGGALGAALVASPGRCALSTMALGEDLDLDATRRFLDDCGIAYQTLPEDQLTREVARRLAQGQVVGWMQGRGEYGPRALGQRSILCDPRDAASKDRLNARVKHREPFRPFAPSVLAERSSDLFELPAPRPGCPAPGAWTRRFMTSTVAARDGRVPGAVHVDGTARVQEVHAADLPRYAGLIARFEEETGVPCLINTSFNLAGEPIVQAVAEGWATTTRGGLDALAIGPYLVAR